MYQTSIQPPLYTRTTTLPRLNRLFNGKKTCHNKDYAAASKIPENDDPYVIKSIGEDITTEHSWRQDQEEILYGIVQQKFLQNKDIHDRFLSSPYTEYYECTVGNKWGCGSNSTE